MAIQYVYRVVIRMMYALCCATVFFLFVLCVTEQAGYAQEGSKEFRNTKQRAERGNAQAQNLVGIMYLEGSGVAKNERNAAEWFKKSAENGHSAAQHTLGAMYAQGLGVPQDERKAAEWYQKAADQGESAAQYDLGQAYFRGRGLPKDERKAAEWFEKSAKRGNVNAQVMAGLSYSIGTGVPKDDTKAVFWFQKAAGKGHADGQFMLGLAYAAGSGVPLDRHLAMAWLVMAAERGNADAQAQIDRICAFIRDNMKRQAVLSDDVSFIPALMTEEEYSRALIAVNNPAVPRTVRGVVVAGIIHRQARKAYETIPPGELKRKTGEKIYAAGAADADGEWKKSIVLSQEALDLMGLDPDYTY